MRQIVNSFLEHVIYNLIFPLTNQEHIGKGKDFWCLDWWAIEIGKYFFEGEHEYLRFPKARRLEDNGKLDKNEIVRLGRQKQLCLNEIERSVRTNGYSGVLVFENCRGLNTLLVSSLEVVNKIYVVIDSEFPEVVEKTRAYLSTLDNIKVFDSDDLIEESMVWMKTDSFLRSVGEEK